MGSKGLELLRAQRGLAAAALGLRAMLLKHCRSSVFHDIDLQIDEGSLDAEFPAVHGLQKMRARDSQVGLVDPKINQAQPD